MIKLIAFIVHKIDHIQNDKNKRNGYFIKIMPDVSVTMATL